MTTFPSVSIAVLTSEIDTLKQQVHSAVDVFCTGVLRSHLELTRQDLDEAIATLNTVLHQLKDKGKLSSSNADLTVLKLSSTQWTLLPSAKNIAAGDDETNNNMLLSRVNRLEQWILEIVQKGEQQEQRRKVLDQTWATKQEICELQDQLSSRMFPLEYSLKGLDSEMKSRFARQSEELGANNQRLQNVERSQVDSSESMGQELNMIKLMMTELDKKIVDVKDAISASETNTRVLTRSVSQVQEEMSDIEKKISKVGKRMSDAELKTSDIEDRLLKTKLATKNHMQILSIKTDQLICMVQKKMDSVERLKAALNKLKDRTVERGVLSTKVNQMEQNLSHLSQLVRKQHHTTASRPAPTKTATDDNVGDLSKVMFAAAAKLTKDFYQSKK